MLAVIENCGLPDVAMLPIAGRPLVIRQLQWLRASGFDQVGLEVRSDSEGAAVSLALGGTPLGWDVVPIVSARSLGAAEVARRAGFDEAVPVLAVPGDLLGDSDLADVYVLAASYLERCAERSRGDLVLELPTAAFSERRHAAPAVRLLRGSVSPSRAVLRRGWGAKVRCGADAIAVGAAMLDGRARGRGLVIHAAERAPGVFVARGAHIHSGATVIPPVLVGARSLVLAGARIGPRAFLGEDVTVERGAVLTHAIVEDDTIVGETFTASNALVSPRGMRSAEPGGTLVEIDDPLVLAHRKDGTGGRGEALRMAATAAALSALTVGVLVAGQ